MHDRVAEQRMQAQTSERRHLRAVSTKMRPFLLSFRTSVVKCAGSLCTKASETVRANARTVLKSARRFRGTRTWRRQHGRSDPLVVGDEFPFVDPIVGKEHFLGVCDGNSPATDPQSFTLYEEQTRWPTENFGFLYSPSTGRVYIFGGRS